MNTGRPWKWVSQSHFSCSVWREMPHTGLTSKLASLCSIAVMASVYDIRFHGCGAVAPGVEGLSGLIMVVSVQTCSTTEWMRSSTKDMISCTSLERTHSASTIQNSARCRRVADRSALFGGVNMCTILVRVRCTHRKQGPKTQVRPKAWVMASRCS